MASNATFNNIFQLARLRFRRIAFQVDWLSSRLVFGGPKVVLVKFGVVGKMEASVTNFPWGLQCRCNDQWDLKVGLNVGLKKFDSSGIQENMA